MDDRKMIEISLEAGESRQFLIEGGSTLLIVSGCAGVRSPFGWLAESIHQSREVLDAEEHLVIDRCGWLEFSGVSATRIVLIPPATRSLWSTVGRCLGEMLLTDRSTATSQNPR